MFFLPPVTLKSGSEDETQQATWESNADLYLSTTQDPHDLDCEDSGNQGQGQGQGQGVSIIGVAVEFQSLSNRGTERIRRKIASIYPEDMQLMHSTEIKNKAKLK